MTRLFGFGLSVAVNAVLLSALVALSALAVHVPNGEVSVLDLNGPIAQPFYAQVAGERGPVAF